MTNTWPIDGGMECMQLGGIDMRPRWRIRFITVSFRRPIGNKGKLLYTCVRCMATVLCYGGELLLIIVR